MAGYNNAKYVLSFDLQEKMYSGVTQMILLTKIISYYPNPGNANHLEAADLFPVWKVRYMAVTVCDL